MKRIVSAGGRRGVLEWNPAGAETSFSLAWDGGGAEQGVASVVEVEPGVYSVLLAGASYEVQIAPASTGWSVSVDGRSLSLELLDPRAERHAASAAPGGRQLLSAPMPGRVVRVLVEAGQGIAAGQGLVVVEAMKMQNEVKALREGRVVSVHAVCGETVAAGQVLVVVE